MTKSLKIRFSYRTGIFLLLLSILLIPSLGFTTPQHYLFTAILSEHVTDALVNYEGLCNDGRFLHYIDQLQQIDPKQLDHNEQLAFWLNAYNAYTLKVICENYPIKSINNLHRGGLALGSLLNKTVWDRKLATIKNTQFSLNQIEHDILRKEFNEPRIHFALVRAAKSCPPLRDEAYEADFIDYQLNDQGRIFFADYTKNRFDLKRKVAFISKIFDWFKEDFANIQEQLLLYLSKFLPEKLAQEIRQDAKSWKIKYLKYNWRLNDVKR